MTKRSLKYSARENIMIMYNTVFLLRSKDILPFCIDSHDYSIYISLLINNEFMNINIRMRRCRILKSLVARL